MGEHKVKLQEYLTPMFTAEMGERLETVRKYKFWTQTQLAEKLSSPMKKVSQQTIAEIEHGRTRYGHFSMALLVERLGLIAVEYVLAGRNERLYDRGKISEKYWKEKLKQRPHHKKRGNPFWKKREEKTIDTLEEDSSITEGKKDV